MLHGTQAADVQLSFSLPSICAQRVEDGSVDVGLVPVAEIARQQLSIVADVGIAALGAVRSILLISRVPIRQIRTLAADSGSRTSVQLARVILREQYGVQPQLTAAVPDLDAMLATSDAALIIGDPALRINPAELGLECLDLGAEWYRLTSLPMVFAAWAGQSPSLEHRFSAVARASHEFGTDHLEEIVDAEHASRGITRALGIEYFTRYIQYALGREERKGLEAFLELAQLAPAATINT